MSDIAWTPQEGPQEDLLTCPFRDIFFGGAAGGGKSDGILGHYLKHMNEEGRGAQGVVFRREAPMLEDLITRAQEFYELTGARWFEKKQKFMWPSGAQLRFRAIERASDIPKYMSQAFSWICFEELPTWPNPDASDRLRSRHRTAVASRKWFLSTGNPGCIGHGWVKGRYISPAKPRTPFWPPELLKRGFTPKELQERGVSKRIFIPSSIEDNKILLENDPEYLMQLEMVGSEELVQAWKHGNWDVSLSTFFTEWNEDIHVLPAENLPDHLMRFRAMDWGSKKPFHVLWFAVSDGLVIGGRDIPAGALIIYREWFGGYYETNTGYDLSSEEVAVGIIERESESMSYAVADPQVNRSDGGPTIAEGFHSKGIFWMNADRERIAGWQQCRTRLKGHRFRGEDWQPMVYVMDNCPITRKAIPEIQTKDNTEDAEPEGSSAHVGDTFRYGLMSRPWVYRAKIVRPRPEGFTWAEFRNKRRVYERLRAY